jgi:hypothetical protein
VNALSAFTIQLPVGASIASSSFADQSNPPNKLPMGWSLIAVGGNPSPRIFVNTIALSPPVTPNVAATSLTSLWTWDSSTWNWYFYSPSLENSSGLTNYISTKGYLDFSTPVAKPLDPTMGIWVNHP